MVIIFAHRGASGHAPENTIESFDLAIEMGTKALETDVKATLDGQLVFFHDHGVGKFPLYRPLLTMTASQLQHRLKHQAGVQVPRVVDAFLYYRRKKLLHEITWSIDVPSHLVIDRLMAIAKAFRNEDTLYICNEQLGPLIRWGSDGMPRDRLVWSIRDKQIAQLGPDGIVAACKRHGITTVNVKEGWLSKRLARAIHDAGLHLFIWDCHDERRIERVLSLHPDAIYSNYPDLAAQLVKRHGMD
ncbi:MAG: glycerophosphodiester phosphodiesterase [Candidatus Lokiarchaeota archaeon]|nr:glycerophosphodiester phosphodiesterase [Candidatus Lokiarchaeota archaeon]